MESKVQNTGTATLTVDGKSVELPVYIGSEGDPVIDVRTLYKATGHFTLDPGFTSTASCESQITFIDGEKGILLYRGYPIDQLAEQANFMEVAYLLQYGELPKADELATFEHDVRMHTMLHTQIDRFFDGFRRDSHPMAMLVGSIGALSAFYSDAMDIEDPEQRRISSIRLIAKMPTLAARIFKYTQGQAYVSPRNDLNYSENFLRMCFKIDAEDYTIDPLMARAMDRIFTLHADHEQNASTSTVRLAGSSDAHPFACIAAGAASLWGPSHGGANEAALNMLREIGRPERIPEFIARAKDKSDPFRLMGFGHRVYRNYDPRARVMQQTAHEVLKATGKQNDPIMAVAMELERIALSDEYFIERQLYPNVDFYSGITLSAMGFPTEMFTVLFALARTAGWVAQWNEFHTDPTSRIGRPRQIYTGPARRDFVPTSAR